MSEEQRLAVIKAHKIAFKALGKWMDEHIRYQLAYVHASQESESPKKKKKEKKNKVKDKRPRETKSENKPEAEKEAPVKKRAKKKVIPRPQYTGCGPDCHGNVVAGTPCPKKSEATPGTGVRHGGKTHPVCDECRKAVKALRRKKAREAKKTAE